MSSLKRSSDCFETDLDYLSGDIDPFQSFGGSSSLFSSPQYAETQAASSSRSWNGVWEEVIGDSPALNDKSTEQKKNLEGFWDLPVLSEVNDAQKDIESWFSADLRINDFGNVDDLHMGMIDMAEQSDVQSDLCYGMIYRVQALLHGNMSEVSRCLRAYMPKGQTHFVLDIKVINDDLFVCIPKGINIAQLNLHLTEALIDPLRSQSIRLEALVHARSIFEDIGAASKANAARTTININVYGPRIRQNSIGREFSAKKIWLQRPDWLSPNSVYDNPHVIKFESTQPMNDAAIPILVEPQDKVTSFRDSIQDVYSQLKRDSQLEGIAHVDRLRTSLLPHQAKAVEFMLQREIGPVPENFRLWEPSPTSPDSGFRHKITGFKSQTPPSETGGGILADEMGMGKTYSMIALVISSLMNATRWAMDHATHVKEDILPTKILSRATLVIVPNPLLLRAWDDEIRLRTDLSLKVLVHHGTDRPRDPSVLADHDIVLTTYHTLAAEHTRSRPATDIVWYRIVLDEAHVIRRMTTVLHKRVAELDAKFRWCLTGTPIQNNLDEVGSLFSFLKLYPFDRLGVFRKYISVPFGEGGSRRLEGQNNLVTLFDSMGIRRTKGHLDLAMPLETTHTIEISPEERRQYEKTKEDMKRALQNLAGDYENRNRMSMFQAQLQLRLLCNHGTFQHQFHWAQSRNSRDAKEDAFTSADGGLESMCSGCNQMMPSIFTDRIFGQLATCAHVWCADCKEGTDGTCALCAETLGSTQRHATKKVSSSGSHHGYFRTQGQSRKMDALVADVLAAAAAGDKSIVFSCWTTTLDLIGLHFQRNAITFDRIDGDYGISQRQKVLDRFQNDPVISTLIMTTGVGAFGLNIIAANRVFLVEPQWNPSVEEQAVGRTIRIGQQKAVHVTRYIVRGTVEEDIQKLQVRKRGMAKITSHVPDDTNQYIKSEYPAFG